VGRVFANDQHLSVVGIHGFRVLSDGICLCICFAPLVVSANIPRLPHLLRPQLEWAFNKKKAYEKDFGDEFKKLKRNNVIIPFVI